MTSAAVQPAAPALHGQPPAGSGKAVGPPTDDGEHSDARRPLAELFRDLRTSPDGLGRREAARRLTVYGPNTLSRAQGRRWPAELLSQFTQPLAVLLAVAAVLAWAGGTPALSAAVLAVILLNAAFAFVQERQAERAVDALSAFLPPTARVIRDRSRQQVPATDLVPGDVLVLAEGDRVCADARIIDGAVQLDLSALTGESVPTSRSGEPAPLTGSPLDAHDLVFSGTSCTGGEANTVVTRTGMHTELGRIAALSQRGTPAPSPLERQVRRVTWIIAAISVVVGVAFVPAGLAAGLGWAAAITFSIGLIVANVPEGLLPTITLALAAGVRELAGRGAVVKRLSAVETLGSVTIICTDKTGTLTQNRMRATQLWLPGAGLPGADLESPDPAGVELDVAAARGDRSARLLVTTAAACTTAEPATDAQPGSGDPTELALLALATSLGVGVDSTVRAAARRVVFHFDPHLQRMTTLDEEAADAGQPVTFAVHTKGAPESVLPCCTHLLDANNAVHPLDETARRVLTRALDGYAAGGLRVLAVARRIFSPASTGLPDRVAAESGLVLLGLVAMVDPPRPAVPAAVREAHRAGIRIHVVTGDYGPTAANVARQVGIGAAGSRIVTGTDLDALSDAGLDELLTPIDEIVFARISPEGKLRICEALQAAGHVVAMTGDGVNDAPALRHADIGVAMGRSGTDVAREAAVMVLTDDDFATIVTAVGAGRQVFDNVRKFVLYIFAHAVPEVVPFLVFALSGGSVPLPLTVLQILAIDLGTETLPALALGREPAEPGAMDRPPRPSGTGVIDRTLLLRAWLLLGTVSAVLVMAAYLLTLRRAGWHLGDPTGPGSPLHHAYLQATTITFAAIVACQVGTAFAARTDRASLFTVGLSSNPLLLWGIAFELLFTAAVIYLPWLQDLFGTASLQPGQLTVLVPFPFVVWGADELVRLARRRRSSRSAPLVGPAHEPAAVPVDHPHRPTRGELS